MNTITGLGKYLFALPFLGFGAGHFMNAEAMAGMAPGGSAMVYFTGLALVAAAISIMIGRVDKLATLLLGVFLLLTAFMVHMSGMMDESATEMAKTAATGNFLKDIALAGAAWMYSNGLAQDNAVVG